MDFRDGIDPATTPERQRRALLVLAMFLQGERDRRRGETLTEDEADSRFRGKLEFLRSG